MYCNITITTIGNTIMIGVVILLIATWIRHMIEDFKDKD